MIESKAKPKNALEIHDLHKVFTIRHRKAGTIKRAILNVLLPNPIERKEVIRGLSLTVPYGQTLALVGRNGSGKSTLLSLIARVYRPTSGTITVGGILAPLLELGAGFHPDLTGYENLDLYGAILGITPKQMVERLDDIVNFAFDTPDLREKLDTPLRNYSDGMKMRLGFSIAIHTYPEVLIVDEVLAVGDEAFQQKCYRAIRHLQEQGKTIVFVSHDLQVIREVASRVIWLDKGSIRMDGGVEEVLSEYKAASSDPDFHT